MRWWIVAVVVALGLVRVRTASACSCVRRAAYLGDEPRELPREATLYLWTIPEWMTEPVVLAFTMDGQPVPYDDETLFESTRYGVHRLRIHAPATGDLEVTSEYLLEPFTFHVVDEPAMRPPQIAAVTFEGRMDPCERSGWYVSFDGNAPAAFHVRGTLDGHPVDAYLPSEVTFDDEHVPMRDHHDLSLSLSYCGPWYLDPDARIERRDDDPFFDARWKDVEISRLEVDGREVAIASGELALGLRTATLPTFAAPVWPSPKPRPAGLGPATATSWWPVGAGAGGGLVLGGFGWIGLARRRRSR